MQNSVHKYGMRQFINIIEGVGGYTPDEIRLSPFGPQPVSDEIGYLYHGTSKARVPSIRRDGLVVSKKSRFARDPFIGDYSIGKLFFTTSIDKAKFYALEASKSKPILLRVPTTSVPNTTEDTKDTYSVFVEQSIPPSVIEYWSGTAWTPIN